MKNKRPVSLSKSRPPLAPRPHAKLSKKTTQTLVRSHHQLNKRLAAAEAKGDDTEVHAVRTRIAALGGLESYQLASIQGQSNERGGDSSIVLMEWLNPFLSSTSGPNVSKPSMLEVGALSTRNACSRSNLFSTIERIDLHSQGEGIQQQDFMERPLPADEGREFDIISLSLVLNFVPDTTERGEMLKRTTQFLHQRERQDFFPSLFLVLPAACIANSRYMNEELLTLMMASLGYVLLRRKQSAKLVYYLWLLRDSPAKEQQDFRKEVVNEGKGRNNFCIVLKA